jgi:hypothetical protein
VQIVVSEDAQRQEIGRFFHEDRITWTGEVRANQIQRVRDAIGHEQVIGIDRKTVSPAQESGQRHTEIAIPLLRAILQEGRVSFREAGFCGTSCNIKRQERKVRVADAQVDHAWWDVDLRGGDVGCHGISIVEFALYHFLFSSNKEIVPFPL